MPKLTIAGHTIQDSRQLKALTGVSEAEFQDLLIPFSQFVHQYYEGLKPLDSRLRAIGGGKHGVLGGPTATGMERKLLFVLIYLKAYPTFDVFGFITGLERSRCCRWVQTLLPILEASLGRKLVLPERKIRDVGEFMRKFPGVQDLFVDGTERPVQKPKDLGKRKKLYSGKKKTTTRKHIIACDEHERILILGRGKTGRRHDKRIADRQQIIQSIPDSVDAWVDSGFSGMQHNRPPDKTHMPKRATKNQPLSDEERADNRVIGGLRVVVEHAIGHVKRYNAASDIWRNKTAGMDDQVMLLAAGLWNLHLNHNQGIIG